MTKKVIPNRKSISSNIGWMFLGIDQKMAANTKIAVLAEISKQITHWSSKN